MKKLALKQKIENEFIGGHYEGDEETEKILSKIVGKPVKCYDTKIDDGVDDDETEEIPERFIEERGLAEIGICPALVSELHTHEVEEIIRGGSFAVCLAVKEIAPSADDLTDHYAGAYHIEGFLPLDLFIE